MTKNKASGRADLSPAELKAIEEHKYYMSQGRGGEVGIDEAIRDFKERYLAAWLKEKTRTDNMEQLAEIERYRNTRAEEVGRDLGEEAVEEWRARYADIWRQEKESLIKNGFLSIAVTVKNESGLHVRPCVTLASIAKKFDCDVYIHKEGMEHYNFKLNGKPFMNVRSVLASLELVALCAAKGDHLEFVAYGNQAREALDAIRDWVDRGCD